MANNQIVEYSIKEDARKVLEITDTLPNYAPISGCQVADFNRDGNPQIYTICSAGKDNSHLRTIKQGLKVK